MKLPATPLGKRDGGLLGGKGRRERQREGKECEKTYNKQNFILCRRQQQVPERWFRVGNPSLNDTY
jgi:hypothetical protein